MNLSYTSSDKSSNITGIPPTYKLTVPTYIDNIDDAIYYDYIVVKPTGTDCFIIAEPPNIFKFYHITPHEIGSTLPFLKICIPKICISTKANNIAYFVSCCS